MDDLYQTLFFIHIPKTAGSSFRKAALDYFGKSNTVFDYGARSDETHPDILKFDYKNKNRYAAASKVLKKAKFLSGHVPYAKYGPFIYPQNIVTFLRSPDQQVKSHYEHYKRHHGYTGSFVEFVQEKRFANLQSRLLKGIDPEAIGLIGLTEKYDESIALLNSQQKISIQSIAINQNSQKESDSYVFSDEEKSLIQEHNQEDFALYEYAVKRFHRQQQAILNNKEFVRLGVIKLPPMQALRRLSGWLTSYDTSKIQHAQVWINGEVTAEISGNEYISEAKEKNMNRNGFIGFSYRYPQSIKSGDLIEIRLKEDPYQVLFSNHY